MAAKVATHLPTILSFLLQAKTRSIISPAWSDKLNQFGAIFRNSLTLIAGLTG
jgi:hypothetical protein